MYITVKTKNGQVCRLPEGIVVSSEAVNVPKTAFVRRRLADGSLIKVNNKAGKKEQ